jgi:hypothetical protein
MTPKLVVRLALVAVVLAATTATLSAQAVEIYPNAGAFWPSKTDFGKLKADGIYGFKIGTFLDQNVQLEGSMGYINHFEMGDLPNPLNPAFGITQPKVYSILYDVNGAWNFGERSLGGARVSPFLSVGVGGLSAWVKDAPSVDITGGGFIGTDPVTGAGIPNPGRRIVMEDNDTFFTVNYGGGVKAMRVWGPMGFRADIRGRSIPNFYGDDVHWPELTGGVIFTWGER